jgi:hypothetical protein
MKKKMLLLNRRKALRRHWQPLHHHHFEPQLGLPDGVIWKTSEETNTPKKENAASKSDRVRVMTEKPPDAYVEGDRKQAALVHEELEKARLWNSTQGSQVGR